MWQFAIGYKVSHEANIEGDMGDNQLKETIERGVQLSSNNYPLPTKCRLRHWTRDTQTQTILKKLTLTMITYLILNTEL